MVNVYLNAEMMKDLKVKTQYSAFINTSLFAVLLKMEINLISIIDVKHVLIQILFISIKVIVIHLLEAKIIWR